MFFLKVISLGVLVSVTTQLTFTCSKSTIETLKKVGNMFKDNNKRAILKKCDIYCNTSYWCINYAEPHKVL